MDSFNLWLERKFRKLPPEIEAEIDLIVPKILSREKSGVIGYLTARYDPDSPTRYVPIIVGKLERGVGATYYPEYDFVIVDSEEKDPNMLKKSISHEAGHAIDRKTKLPHPQTISGTPEYYKSPIEFDAYGSDLERSIKQRLFDKRIPIENRLKELEVLKNKLRTGALDTSQSPFKDWLTSPGLWRKFRQKLFNTITEIEEKIKQETKVREFYDSGEYAKLHNEAFRNIENFVNNVCSSS